MRTTHSTKSVRKAAIGICVSVALVGAGMATFYWLYYLPAAQRFNPVKATQFYSLAITWWLAEYEAGTKKLPSLYPSSFDDLAKYGYLTSEFMTNLNKGLSVEFYPPPKNVEAHFIIVKAASPSTTWVVRLSKDDSTDKLFPCHEHFDKTTER